MKKSIICCLVISVTFIILGLTEVFAQSEDEGLRVIIKKLEAQIKENTYQLEKVKQKLAEREKVKEIAPVMAEALKPVSDTGWFIEAKGLFLTPRGNDIDVAIVDADDDSQPEGSAEGANFDNYIASGKWRSGYTFDNNSRLSLSYWHLGADEDFSITKPSGGTLHTLLNHPAPFFGDLTFDVADSVTGDLDLKLDVMDLDYTKPWFDSGNLTTDWLIGLRYAKFDQHLLATYNFSGVIASEECTASGDFVDRVTSDIVTEMLGPKLGIITKYDFNKKVNFYTEGVFSLLVGETDAKYTDAFELIDGIAVTTDIKSKYESVFPVIELELGLEWIPRADWEFKVGYFLSYWTDVITQKAFVDDSRQGKAIDQGKSVTFDGIVLSGKYIF